MNVLYVSDEGYTPLLAASLESLYKAHSKDETINTYIISDDISDLSREKLRLSALKYGRSLTFIPKPDVVSLVGTIPKLYKWCDNIFCRLFIPTCIKEDKIDRILYIDCDTIIKRSLADLWNMDLMGNYCAAGLECMGDLHKKLIGLAPQDPYYNSGVILIDLEKWKKYDIENKCSSFLNQYKDYLEYPDEAVLNGVLKGNIMTFPPEYNLTTLKCTFSFDELRRYRKSRIMYSRAEYAYALSNPAIIHYTANFLIRRPWFEGEGEKHYFEKSFREAYMETAWKDELFKTEIVSTPKRMARFFTYHNRSAGIFLFGFIYSYCKPLYRRVKQIIRGYND